METTDRLGLLDTDARIIAENETYAVIALRLKKNTIARALPFLAALADLTSSTVDVVSK